MEPWIWTAVGAGFAAISLALAHWLPKPKEPDLIPRYVYGTAILWLAFLVCSAGQGDIRPALQYGVIIAAGGLATCAAYWWDDALRAIRKARKAESTDEELRSD